jgi:23S rRNA (pseudouridine1915-N3)-methyltransferase
MGAVAVGAFGKQDDAVAATQSFGDDIATVRVLVPQALRAVSPAAFLERLEALDAPMSARLEAARKNQTVLRYVARLFGEGEARVELLELPESKRDGAAARADEAKVVLSKLKAGDVLMALDERGKGLTSPQLAQWLQQHRDLGRSVTCVIGGDEGLDQSVRAAAQLTLSLSAMTLPHRLARLVLMEQLYRAFTILRGEPYHK